MATLAAAAIVAALAGCAWIDTQQRAKGYRATPGTLSDWTPVSAREEALWLDLPPAQFGAHGDGQSLGQVGAAVQLLPFLFAHI